MTAILGINQYHTDSAACLLLDGKLVGAVAEERLGNRTKHSSGFPKNAVRWLLHSNGLRLSDLTHVALPRSSKANLDAKIRWLSKHPFIGGRAALEHFTRKRKSDSLAITLANCCGEDSVQFYADVQHVEHHLAHIASSYFPSPFDSSTAGFSYDGSGDFVSGMAARCEGTSIKVIDRMLLPNSLGFFYTSICHLLGFDRLGEEYKVMGLAAYGTDRFADTMNKLIYTDDKSWYRLGSGYFNMHSGGSSEIALKDSDISLPIPYSKKLSKILIPARNRNVPLEQVHKDIAHSTQKQFERIALANLNKLGKLVPSQQLVLSGGCALNGVLNGKIKHQTPYSKIYIPSAPADDGTCIGAAYWVWHNHLKKSERFQISHAYWGPEYTEDEVRKSATAYDFKIQQLSSIDAMIDAAAELIANGNVIGWFQGRCEWGPRALGNRSILADPSVSDMQQLLNEKIKKRESFRPFAPSVLEEDAEFYFNESVTSPFMMHVVDIKHEWRDRLPAITHVDGTGRVQTVNQNSNPLFHKLIDAVKMKTGIGMVLNTSFNENEPIVDTPQQAIDCFARTGIDALCMYNLILRRE